MTDLKKSRIIASKLSGGTSDNIIKNKIIFFLKKYNTKEKSLLDFGSGKGELLKSLKNFEFSKLSGTDLFQRPENLESQINWYELDLNEEIKIDDKFDFIICSETIEHLENPRHIFRSISKLLKKNGVLILTMPNNQSFRSICALIFANHFVAFLNDAYPAHITSLVELDLIRMSNEVGLSKPSIHYTDFGVIPKFTSYTWQKVSFGFLKGKYFSDNLIMIVNK